MIGSVGEWMEMVADVAKERTIAATAMNAESSRAVMVYSITVEQQHVNGLTGELTFVDLMGSERPDTKVDGAFRLKQNAGIRAGINAISEVVRALGAGAKVVPYRASPLTRLLSETMGGGGRMVFIATVSPAQISLDESSMTLRAANAATKCCNKQVRTHVHSEESLRLALQAERRCLRRVSAPSVPNAPEVFRALTESDREVTCATLNAHLASVGIVGDEASELLKRLQLTSEAEPLTLANFEAGYNELQPSEARRAFSFVTRYTDVAGLGSMLRACRDEAGEAVIDVKLLKASWLAAKGFARTPSLPYRQVLEEQEPEAFADEDLIERCLAEVAEAAAGDSDPTMTYPGIVVLSYCWESPEHPDARGLLLKKKKKKKGFIEYTSTRRRVPARTRDSQD